MIKIIAEAGVNHNGSLRKALKLVKKAKECGADIVKFQFFSTKELVNSNTKLARYQKNNTQFKNQFSMLKSLELKYSDFSKIKNYCTKLKIEFLATAFDIDSLKKLIKLGIKRIKIPSGEIYNIPFINFIIKQKLPILISTGTSDMQEIKEIIKYLKKKKFSKKKITLMQCSSSYPADEKNANIMVLHEFKKIVPNIGYSDHTLGIASSIASIINGAKILEKHFTLNSKESGPDHRMSMEPKNFKNYIKECRAAEHVMGNKIKKVDSISKLNANISRRGIYAKKKIFKGEKITSDKIFLQRPSSLFPDKNYFKIINKKAQKKIDKGAGVRAKDVF
jgi:N,N'-diacetyllegionaminate synthase